MFRVARGEGIFRRSYGVRISDSPITSMNANLAPAIITGMVFGRPFRLFLGVVQTAYAVRSFTERCPLLASFDDVIVSHCDADY